MSAETEWFSLPTAAVGNRELLAEIRAWVPGDGLVCRSAAQSLRVPCGAPVAVVRTHNLREGKRGRPTVANYCERHVAEVVRRQVGDADWRGNTSTQQTVRRAEETVLAAHWDEYQEALAAAVAEQRAKYFSVLPDWLRAGFEAAEAVAS